MTAPAIPVTPTALAAAAVAAAPADGKYDLRLRLQPGQAWAFTSSMDTDMNVRATSNGQVLQDSQTVVGQRRGGSIAVKAARDGVPSAVVAAFAKDCVNTSKADGQEESEPWPLAGKTVTLKRAADGQVTNDADGLDPALAAEVNQLMEMDQSLYPKDPVAVGEAWTPDPTKLRQQFQLAADDTLTVKCRLTGVVQLLGRKAYEVGITGTIGKAQDGMNLRMELGGNMRYDAATGVPLQGNLSARVTIKGEQQIQGPNGPAIVVLTGGGRVTMTQSTTPQDPAAAAAAAAAANGAAHPAGPLGPVAGPAGPVAGPPINPGVPAERPGGPERPTPADDRPAGGASPLDPRPSSRPPTDGKLAADSRAGDNRPGDGRPAAGGPAARPGRPTSPFAGFFKGTELAADLDVDDAGRVTGSITKATKQYRLAGTVRDGQIIGAFEASGVEFNFAATVEGDTMTFETEGSRYVMKRW